MAHSHLLLGAGKTASDIRVRRIGMADLIDALSLGAKDFNAMPTHAMFLCVIYPVVGLLAARLAFGYSVLPLLYPLVTGFALIGPLAALGLYELSRRREAGLDTSVTHALDVVKSSSIGAIIALGLLLMGIFVLWIAAANALYIANFGYAPPSSVEAFIKDVLTTRPGWNLIIFGNAIGFIFAVLVLTVSVVSFPLMLDRDVGAAVALSTSIRVVLKNPVTMAAWGMIVAALAVYRRAAAVHRTDSDDADPWPRHLASLSPRGGGRRRPSPDLSRTRTRQALGGRFPGGAVSLGEVR